MADRDRDREPRWNSTGYWTEHPQEENWEGDRSLSRNYNREDQRRYAARGQDIGDRLRSLRGQGSEPRETGDWNERERYRGYGTDLARQEQARGRDRSGQRGQSSRDRNRAPFTEQDRRGDYDRHRDYEWETAQGYRTSTDRDWQASDENLVDNYWGQRERNRRSRSQDAGAWWRSGPEEIGGFTSGRQGGWNADGVRLQNLDDDEREFDLDPGYAYEFGTDFDFMRDTSRETSRRNFSRQHYQGAQNRHTWDVPGPFSGVGPSNYQRPDERIREDVCERLMLHGKIDSRRMEIQVQNGEVTLSGNVRRRDEKYLAEDVAGAVSGVKDIHNHIRVEQ